jgi:hypothetical protein
MFFEEYYQMTHISDALVAGILTFIGGLCGLGPETMMFHGIVAGLLVSNYRN